MITNAIPISVSLGSVNVASIISIPTFIYTWKLATFVCSILIIVSRNSDVKKPSGFNLIAE